MLQPLDENVLVKVEEKKEEQTPGGIFIPEIAQNKSNNEAKIACVIAVGPGKPLENGERQHSGLKAGDEVLLSPFAGSSFLLDDERFLVVKQNEILGVIREQEK